MSPRSPRRRGGARGTGTTGGKPPAVSLPASGLAAEILAAFERQKAAEEASEPAPAAPGPEAAPRSPAGAPAAAASAGTAPTTLGPARIYSFADSLERQEAQPAAPVERPESWVTFELAGELYALPVARIQEIQRARGITRVPHAPAPVRGIANLRGRVLVVVDLRQRLGLPPAAADERSRILVVSSRERSLGLLVDTAHQVVGLLPSRIEAPPSDLVDDRSAYLAGVVQLDDKLVIALDIDQLLLVPEGGDAQPQREAGGPP